LGITNIKRKNESIMKKQLSFKLKEKSQNILQLTSDIKQNENTYNQSGLIGRVW